MRHSQIARGVVCGAAVFVSISTPAYASHIDLVGDGRSRGGNGIEVGSTTDSLSTAPFSLNQSFEISGTSSQTTYSFSHGAEFTTFLFEFVHQRTSQGFAQTSSTSQQTLFTPTENMTYSFAGEYGLGGTGRLLLEMQFVDTTTGETLFGNYQESFATTDEFFVLGGQGGDSLNDAFWPTGSLTGELIAGRTYSLFYNFVIQQAGSPFDPATGEGWFSLALIVPLPPAVWLGSLGIVAVIVFRRKIL